MADAAQANTKASKELTTILSNLPALKEAADFHEWDRQLKIFAFQFMWATWILGGAGEAEPANLSEKEKCDKRNAYTTLVQKCEGHAVADALEDCVLGDAKEAYNIIRGRFFRKTATGLQTSLKDFYSMTMANSQHWRSS